MNVNITIKILLFQCLGAIIFCSLSKIEDEMVGKISAFEYKKLGENFDGGNDGQFWEKLSKEIDKKDGSNEFDYAISTVDSSTKTCAHNLKDGNCVMGNGRNGLFQKPCIRQETLFREGVYENRMDYGSKLFFSQYQNFNSIQSAIYGLEGLASAVKDRVMIEKRVIGKSRCDREINVLSFRKADDVHSNLKNGAKDGFVMDGSDIPKIWIGCGQHGREWIAPASCLYLASMLALGDRDRKVSHILDKAAIYIAPLLNPDGYVKSWEVDRMWRKNGSCPGVDGGVDLNRNWPTRWAQIGSSFNPKSLLYHGSSAGSEPEVAAVIAHVLSLRNLQLAIDVHSYGQMVLRTPSFSKIPSIKDLEYKRLGDQMALAMEKIDGLEFKSMLSGQLYENSGSMDDWFNEKFDIPAITIELRDKGKYGFQLPADQISRSGLELFAALDAAVNYFW